MQGWHIMNILQGHSLALIGLYVALMLALGIITVSFRGAVEV